MNRLYSDILMLIDRLTQCELWNALSTFSSRNFMSGKIRISLFETSVLSNFLGLIWNWCNFFSLLSGFHFWLNYLIEILTLIIGIETFKLRNRRQLNRMYLHRQFNACAKIKSVGAICWLHFISIILFLYVECCEKICVVLFRFWFLLLLLRKSTNH